MILMSKYKGQHGGKKGKKIRASCATFFGRQKRRLAHITEPSNDDYDNDVSDHNFGTFDDFGVKNDQKVSLNMILMSKYKGQHGGKKGYKKSGKAPSPFRAMPERNRFLLWEVFPYITKEIR